jgi:hypothetical protein
MRLLRHPFAIGVLSALGLSAAAHAPPDEPLDPAVARLVTQIAGATSADEAAKGYVQLFKSPNRQLIRQLKGLPEDGVALRAAWEEVLLDAKFPKDKVNPKLDQPIAVARFLGFIEGRLRLSLPDWWEEAVEAAFLGGCGRVVPGVPKPWPYHVVPFRDWTIGMPLGQSIQENDKAVVLKSGDETAAVSAVFVKEHFGKPECLSILIDKDRSFVAYHNDFGYSFSLLCLDRKSGNLIWKATVWDWANDLGTSGPWYDHVAVVGNDQRVFVIGCGVSCFYIEAFERASGKSIIRFANWYFDEMKGEKK